ncbi:MAG: hypothetical protein B6I19_06905 [Bacteroidetes bacterium 4572_114]|nr:MAG: hypothetical protein B6I19_06905 [Bacteroidetes bacterium 4572_114]
MFQNLNITIPFEVIKDGGNTEGLVADVETSWPQDMWELREELLGKSPHLSMDVLKAAADKTEVLPESIIFEIMAANPDELKKEELIKYLEDKENPLPQYMIGILRQLALGTTYKTVLQQQLAVHNQIKTRAAHDMIRSIISDTVMNFPELRNWLDNLGGIRADRQIVSTYLTENNYTDALALAGLLPGLYELEGNTLTEHNYYMEVLNLRVTVQQQGRNILDLTGNEIAQLNNIAANSRGIAGAEARGILEFGYGYSYCDCLNVGDNQGYKSYTYNPASINQAYGMALTVDPNPAKDWTVFNYTLPENAARGLIKISDVYGKLIDSFTVTGTQGQKLWDTRNIRPGVYFYFYDVNGMTESGKIIISK